MTKAALPPLRLVIFDATDTRRRTLLARTPDGAAGVSPGLTPIWRAGAVLHSVALLLSTLIDVVGALLDPAL